MVEEDDIVLLRFSLFSSSRCLQIRILWRLQPLVPIRPLPEPEYPLSLVLMIPPSRFGNESVLKLAYFGDSRIGSHVNKIKR